MFTKKIVYIPILILALALGGAHAVASNEANQAAQTLVNELVTKMNQFGVPVEVGEVEANPYTKDITVNDVLITDDTGRQHQIGMLTVSDIELNPNKDFIYAMDITTRDTLFTVTGGGGTPSQEKSLVEALINLGITKDKIGQDQHLAYRYDPLKHELTLNLQNQFYNPELPDNDKAQLFSVNLHTHFSQIPDLENQLQRLRNNEDMSTISTQWMQTGLITAAIDFKDAGSWQSLVEQGSNKAEISPEEFKAGMKQVMQQQLSALQVISPALRTQLMDASTQFIDSDTPQFAIKLNSKNPDGAGILLVLMASMMSPNAIESYFDIEVDSE